MLGGVLIGEECKEKDKGNRYPYTYYSRRRRTLK